MPLESRWMERASKQDKRNDRPLLMELFERPLRGIGAIEKPTSIILAPIRSDPVHSRPNQMGLADLRPSLSETLGGIPIEPAACASRFAVGTAPVQRVSCRQ